jgi:hypothetical protein
MLPLDGPKTFKDNEAFLDYVQSQTFRYFWEEANPTNGLIRHLIPLAASQRSDSA